MKHILYVLVMLCSCLSFAGGEEGVFDRGNGGDVVICKTAEGTSYELLDLHEFPRLNFTPAKISGQNPQDVLAQILVRIGRHYPLVEKSLREELQIFWREVLFVSSTRIPEVNDEGEYHLRPGCTLKQLAVQWSEQSSQGRRYLISYGYWTKLDPRHQAALVLHEMLYRMHVKNQLVPRHGSSGLRVYVAFFFSEELVSIAEPIRVPPVYEN